MRRVLFATICMLLSCWVARPVQAQLFGARSVGSPISSPYASGGSLSSTSPMAGRIDGGERFIRGNRSRRDFVGSDRNEQSGFVGSGQAIGVGRVQAATEGLRIEASDATRINRPLPLQPAKGMYYPRLELAFNSIEAAAPEIAIDPNHTVHQRLINIAGNDARVTMSGRTAILRGSVDSTHAAELAGLILSFEPGIDQVNNQLQVRPGRVKTEF